LDDETEVNGWTAKDQEEYLLVVLPLLKQYDLKDDMNKAIAALSLLASKLGYSAG
jgi:hypothetical protein